MKRPGFATTFWFIAFVAVTILFLLQRPWVRQSHISTDIIFGAKAFSDSAKSNFNYLGYDIVSVTGTLTGDGIAYKNNSYSVTCYEDRRECLVYSVDEIGDNQVGYLEIPTFYPIMKWTPDEIVASEHVVPLVPRCTKITISLERKTEEAVWVEEPINQAIAACKNADTQIRKFTIESPPFWKTMRKQ
jgi:hypothetical protein